MIDLLLNNALGDMIKNIPFAFILLVAVMIIVKELRKLRKSTDKLTVSTDEIKTQMVDYSYWRKSINKDIRESKDTLCNHDNRIKNLELKDAQDFGREIGK